MIEVVRQAGDIPVETIRLLNDSFNALDLSDAKELELDDIRFVIEDLLHLRFRSDEDDFVAEDMDSETDAEGTGKGAAAPAGASVFAPKKKVVVVAPGEEEVD